MVRPSPASTDAVYVTDHSAYVGFMSIPVDLAALEQALHDFGFGYLLTASPTGGVKAVTVEPRWADGILLTAPSKGSAVNLAANPNATVIFPPGTPKGYTLIVDGTATVTDDGIAMTPATAVLHRPASHSDGPVPPGSCSNDCSHV